MEAGGFVLQKQGAQATLIHTVLICSHVALPPSRGSRGHDRTTTRLHYASRIVRLTTSHSRKGALEFSVSVFLLCIFLVPPFQHYHHTGSFSGYIRPSFSFSRQLYTGTLLLIVTWCLLQNPFWLGVAVCSSLLFLEYRGWDRYPRSLVYVFQTSVLAALDFSRLLGTLLSAHTTTLAPCWWLLNRRQWCCRSCLFDETFLHTTPILIG